MKLIIDTREQHPLEFPSVVGVEIITKGLPVGDYSALHGEAMETVVVERKSVADLYTSFTSNYAAERAKILKAKELGLTYILAVEAPTLEILKGHSYWRGGQVVAHPKSGMAMLRQLMTIQRKYGITCWFCTSRKEMALMVQEFFLAQERVTAE